MLKYKVVYIYGLDGSGKSTVCRELINLFGEKGIKATYKWMRFNHYLSKVINVIGRLRGLSFYTIYPDDTKVGYHHYYKSSFLSATYCLTTIFDTFIASLFKLWIPILMGHQVIVLDRFVFDIIVDLSIDTRNPGLLLGWQGKALRRFLPLEAISIYLDVDKHIIHKRRPDTRWDENFAARKEMYEKICVAYGNNQKVDNNGEIGLTLKSIMKMIKS
jgi:thymidylate kinase